MKKYSIKSQMNESPIKHQFWDNVAYIQKYENITNQQLADSLGITSHSFVYKKSMRQLSIEWAVKIAKQLAEPLDDLFFRDFAKEA